MEKLHDYIVAINRNSFEKESFQEVADFREWLLQENDTTKEEEKEEHILFQYFYSVVQQMSQLRFHAEEYFNSHPHVAGSKRFELPLTQEIIRDAYTGNLAEPPVTVVSKIAQNNITTLEVLLKNIKKILRRERELTKIGSVQQIDSQCLIWLTRQPGVTAAQKAGRKQKLMSVVRKDDYDILENRILKAVLKLCSSYSQRYLRQYGDKYPDSLRVRAVRHLYNCAQAGLRLEVMKHITSIHSLPKPNYVLLHDPHYSKVWNMYMQLLNQTLLMENAWRNRHNLLQEYFLFCMANVCQLHPKSRTLFSSQFWISLDIKMNGTFFKNSVFRRIFIHQNKIMQFIPHNENLEEISASAVLKIDSQQLFLSFVYFPKGVCWKKYMDDAKTNHIYFIFSEEKSVGYDQNNIVLIHFQSDLFVQLNDWFEKFSGDL